MVRLRVTDISEAAQLHMMNGIQDYQKELIGELAKNLALPPRLIAEERGRRTGRTYARSVAAGAGT